MILRGKNAVITGCIQGIGRATLDVFAKEGATIFACAQYETEEFKTHIENLQKQYNVEIFPLYFDLTDEEAVKSVVKTIMQTKKPIDTLVNIAGMTQDALFPMVTKEQMSKVFNINFFSQIIFSQYIVKLMCKNTNSGNKSIINTSSITAMDGNNGQLVYGAVKAAWISATKTMSIELAPKGIRVNVIAPGVIKTAMTENLPKESLENSMRNCALKRLGEPTEVANVICYLASNLSSFVTGQVIRIDGGMSINAIKG